MRNCRYVVSLVSCIALMLLLLVLAGCADSLGRVDDPPKATIIYSAETGKDHKSGLYLVDWPGRKPRLIEPKVTGGYGLGFRASCPQFSPDGTKVLFTADTVLPNGKQVEGEDMDLWILDLKANTAKPLTTDGAGCESPQWSPDGHYISAISYEAYCPEPPLGSSRECKVRLYVWDVRTGMRSRALARYVGGVAWSRDSKYLYYEGSSDKWGLSILRVPRQGGQSELVQGRVPWLSGSGGSASYLGWESPDGKYLSLGGVKLGVKTLGADEVRYFLPEKSPVMQATHKWAPDSSRIALTDRVGDAKTGLMILDTHSGQTKRISAFADLPAIVGWSASGDWIIVIGYNDLQGSEEASLCAVSANTGKVTPLFSLAKATGFDWHELPSR